MRTEKQRRYAVACLGGACGTCKGRVTTGTVSMGQEYCTHHRRGRRRLRTDLPIPYHQPHRRSRSRSRLQQLSKHISTY
ncbi:2Fe-2S iron-sulfur cluster binding domain-containing protein [Rhodococcus erythropolis]|uniref:2Fe-2S iron-sulfur cluster binding domain-containing protein n=1 Tax=Rhodococcus erythropolis TaxID=1833 RepID=UPI0035B5AA7B